MCAFPFFLWCRFISFIQYLHIILCFLPVGFSSLTLRQFICPKKVPEDNEEAHNLVTLAIFYLED